MCESTEPQRSARIAELAQQARQAYAAALAGAHPWWTAVVLTASSARQADRFQREIGQRLSRGALPGQTRYLVVADPGDRRAGSGGATLHALRALVEAAAPTAESLQWWAAQRVLMIHAGGESRRLPQYSLSGKLFGALPARTPWGEPSTVFDEFLALSAPWAARLPAGLLVASGDVLLVAEPDSIAFDQPGVLGIAVRQPAETGTRHGVYILGESNRVYAYLQKPSLSGIRAAGGELPDGEVALDSGLLCFDSGLAASLAGFAATLDWRSTPSLDLYRHFTLALTGQWRPGEDDDPTLGALARILAGARFTACLASGGFTHVGTTSHLRNLIAGGGDFSGLHSAGRRLGTEVGAMLRSSGVVLDSILASGEVGPRALVIECSLDRPLHAAPGSVLHGLEGLEDAVEVPEDTVLHQVPVRLPGGAKATVIRAYGVADNPRDPLDGGATWFGRPIAAVLADLDLSSEEVWKGIDPADRCLWNAQLFPAGVPSSAWSCARWFLGLASDWSPGRWTAALRLSLESSTDLADETELAEARSRRARAHWELAACRLALDGADIRPMLTQSPGLASLSAVALRLESGGRDLTPAQPTRAASLYWQASMFRAQEGQELAAQQDRAKSFELVAEAVSRWMSAPAPPPGLAFRHREVTVTAPVRLDFGGGWSDTPPFCLDWGGAVLNAAITLDGGNPIETSIRRTDQSRIECCVSGSGARAVYSTIEELHTAPGPGDPFAIPRLALRMTGLFPAGRSLAETLCALGGGLEISTAVRLPMGSGLGTSSILAATALAAIHEMLGLPLPPQALSDRVIELEQRMGTGGGWQDQAGGLFPGLKLISTGPGERQRLRIREIALPPGRQAEFEARLVLVYTGITRVAKGLLQEVVGRYLARETHAVEVLHSIKTLALEMAYAVEVGEWDYFGDLIRRHWELNQKLDPHTTNAPVESMLAAFEPHILGAKLAGAGGGGFLILVTRGSDSTAAIRALVAERFAPAGAAVHDWRLAKAGLRILHAKLET